MNSTLLITIIILECLLLLVLSYFKKLTKMAFFCITLITAASCCFAMFRLGSHGKTANPATEKEYMYMAGKLIEEEHPEEALNALGMVKDKDNLEYGIVPLRGLAYNKQSAFQLASMYLEDKDGEYEKKLYELSMSEKTAESELIDGILNSCYTALQFSDSERKELEEKMMLLFLSNTGSGNDQTTTDMESAPGGSITIIKTALSNMEFAHAFSEMKKLAEYSRDEAVTLAEMYVLGYDDRTLMEDDAEYDQLLKELTDSQINVMKAEAASSETSDTEETSDAENTSDRKKLALAKAEYSLGVEALEEEALKRAYNYLSGLSEDHFQDKARYNLEMAYICFRLKNENSAEEFLNKLYDTLLNKSESQLTDMERVCASLKDAYILYSNDPVSSDFDVVYNQTMCTLFSNVLTDTADTAFKEYLIKYLKENFGGIKISKIDTKQFPTVTATVYTIRKDLNITEDSVKLKDTREEINSFSIEKIEDPSISICYVLDVSGSMNGQKIIEAKKALKNALYDLEDADNASLVSFNNNATLLCPLRAEKMSISGMVDNLTASGGTNIAAGLTTGCESLSEEMGPKAIILLSDGYDSDKNNIRAAISMAVSNSIPVYCIGLEGSDEAYLKKISSETGGLYIPVSNSGRLNEIYSEIKSFMKTKYDITYTVTSTDEEYRYIKLESSESKRTAWAKYSLKEAEDVKTFEQQPQMSNYFKEIGGTSIMGG